MDCASSPKQYTYLEDERTLFIVYGDKMNRLFFVLLHIESSNKT